MNLKFHMISYLPIKSFLLFIIITISVTSAWGQTGNLEGFILDKSSNEALIGAIISLDGTSNAMNSDIDGHYQFKAVKPGKHFIMVSYVGYDASTIESIVVENGKTNQTNVLLHASEVIINEVTVTAVRRSGSEATMISAIKASPLISVGISNQQIGKSQDRDASEVVRRIPGITILDDKFIIIRGIPQRYNSVWLNNAATPSSEADVKSFSFDVIPSAMIENIMVFKSPAPELPSDFAGGFVKITTRCMPDKNNLILSFGASYAENTTFAPFYKYKGGKMDALGFDDGTRALPKQMPAHLNEYELAQNPAILDKVTTLGQSLKNNWSATQSNAMPDLRLSFTLNHKFTLKNKLLGNTTSVTYANTSDFNDIQKNTYTIFNFSNNSPNNVDKMHDQQYTKTAKVSLMHNWALFWGNGQKIEFQNLLNQIGFTRTTMRDGIDGYNDYKPYKSAELGYTSRSTYSGQLGGEHPINGGLTKIDWSLGYALANKNQPDLKRYRELRDDIDTSKYFMVFADPSNPDLSSQARYWLTLKETLYSAGINFAQRFAIGHIAPEIKFGIYAEHKNRSFTARNFGYAKGSINSSLGQTYLPVNEIFDPSNINRTTGIKLMEITSKSDSYEAKNDLLAGYLSLRIPVTYKINIYTGVRAEKNRQNLSSYFQGTDTKADVNRDTINFFPSANLTYNFNEKSLLRLAFGKSLNRPEFREIAPFYFVDFDLNAGIKGNTNIKNAYISNYDLRFENYNTSNEIFTIGIFYKDFSHPIETIIEGSSPLQYTFENVASATSYGIETDIRKNLGIVPALKNFNLVFNASLIKSKVHFDKNSLNRDRPLQGQSPYIINAGLYYEQPTNGWMISMLYNIIGKRITAVGRTSPEKWQDIPNIYEMPRHVIDFTASKKIGKHIEIKGGIKDILNQKVIYKQTIDTDVDMSVFNNGVTGIRHFKQDQITRTYNPGRYVTAGIIFNFN